MNKNYKKRLKIDLSQKIKQKLFLFISGFVVVLLYYYFKIFTYMQMELKYINKNIVSLDDDWKHCSSKYLDIQPPNLISKVLNITSITTCRNIIEGNYSNIETLSYMKSYPRIDVSDEEFAKLSCLNIKSSGYSTSNISEEELNFPIAFNFIVHENADQINRQLRTVWRPQNVYCIHADSSSSQGFHNAMKLLSNCFDNIYLIENPVDVIYAGFSRLLADIICMKKLLYLNKKNWKYLINTAGSAFPLLTNLEMVKILKIYNGANDIEGLYNRPLRSRFENKWIEIYNGQNSHINATGYKNSKPPYNIEIVRGSAYGIFSHNFVHFIINDKKAQAILNWSKSCYSPDEHYWSTLHHLYVNPHLHTPGGYNGLPHLKPWLASFSGWGGEYKCNGHFQRGICVLGIGDIKHVIEKKHFFVNKLYDNYQYFALDCLEQWLIAKRFCKHKFMTEYYENLPFIYPKKNIIN